MSMSLTTNVINSVNFVTSPVLTPSSHVVGRISWNETDGTIDIETDLDGVTLQVGQEAMRNVFNETGGTLGDGLVVYVAGENGGDLTAALAQADVLATALVAGVVTADINDNTKGKVTRRGKVRGIDTSAFSEGDRLFLSATTPGGLVNVAPDSPNFVVQIGFAVEIGTSGSIEVDIQQAGAVVGVSQSKVYTLPLRGVTATDVNISGEFRTVAANQVGDYATDFAVDNNHIFLLVHSLTGSGVVTITGTSINETSGVPVAADTETITVDTGGEQYYQSAKKWWEVTNIDIPAGITIIDYDIGVVGYADHGNADFKITGYRLESLAQGVNPDLRFQLIKVNDDGSGKMSISFLEDIGVDADAVGNQIIDGLRTGGDDRSYNPTVGSVWGDGTMLVFKQGDFDTYFASDENVFESSTKDEGFILHFEGAPSGGITNADFVTLDLRYQLL